MNRCVEEVDTVAGLGRCKISIDKFKYKAKSPTTSILSLLCVIYELIPETIFYTCRALCSQHIKYVLHMLLNIPVWGNIGAQTLSSIKEGARVLTVAWAARLLKRLVLVSGVLPLRFGKGGTQLAESKLYSRLRPRAWQACPALTATVIRVAQVPVDGVDSDKRHLKPGAKGRQGAAVSSDTSLSSVVDKPKVGNVLLVRLLSRAVSEKA